jgi:CheY-like chemotaxis protein
VDDEASLRRTLALGLMQYGYTAVPCETGMSALRKLETYAKNELSPDIIIADIRLPDIDGIKLVKIIRFKYPDIPVIIITAYGELVNSEEITSLHVDAFLEKPFTTETLQVECRKILEKERSVARQAQQQVRSVETSVSAYALVSADKECDIFELYQKLFYFNNVLYCDATRGEYDIILLLQGQTQDQVDDTVIEIKEKIRGIESLVYLPVENPMLDESTKGIIADVENALADDANGLGRNNAYRKRVCSYLFIEMEREKLDSIYPLVRLNENVVYCDCTEGSYNLILLVHGSDFSDIDRVVEEKISTIDGILRIKEFPIINLMEM